MKREQVVRHNGGGMTSGLNAPYRLLQGGLLQKADPGNEQGGRIFIQDA
ncbi:hypothetical protein C8R31_102223 [Nitrosospira sp. Nsp2]|nr:hypothetical protein C8R31_102223 [Nitrosospira sp. Nsp2]